MLRKIVVSNLPLSGPLSSLVDRNTEVNCKPVAKDEE